jgi:hypothetical protein
MKKANVKYISGEALKVASQKKRQYVYLAGNISGDNRTYDNVVVINPCANKFNQSMKNVTEDGLAFVREAVKRSQKILRAKDYQLVKICSAIVVNLELHDVNRPMIGTVQELAWAHDVFYVPVIAITGKEDNIYTTHMWMDECCSAKVETVEEAAEMIKTFFLEY